jgi:hypothetical protein
VVNASFDVQYTSRVLSVRMGPEESAKLIETAGGDKQFATLIGLANEPGYKQRVNNWKRRGIPAAVILANQGVIRDLESKSRAA